jgi:hypothetical protein
LTLLANILKLQKNWWIFLLSLSIGLVYVFTTTSAPLLEDDALFILASFDMGTAHSPGYPLYILLTQPFHWLPVSSVALKVHLANAFAATLLVAVLAMSLVRYCDVPRHFAATATLCLGFSALFWSQALIAEVYMLNALLFILIFFSCLRISIDENHFARRVCLLGFMFGLSLSNHWPLTLLVSPVYLVLVWPVLTRMMKHFPHALLGLLIGLLPYLWMYFRSRDPVFSHMGHFASMDDFFYFVSREVYSEADNQPLASWHDKALYIRFFSDQFMSQYSVAATMFILVGFVTQWFTLAKRICIALSLTLSLPIALTLLLGFTYTRLETASISVFPLPLYVASAVWLALGLTFTAKYIATKFKASGILMHALSLALIVSTSYSNYKQTNLNGNQWAVNHARTVLNEIPADTNLFVMDDWLMALIVYLHKIEGVRSDVTVYSEYGTFLSNRLFPYFTTDPSEKNRIVQDFITSSPNPVVVFQNPERYGLPYRDLQYGYWINPDNDHFNLPNLLQAGDAGEPAYVWNNLYWRYLVYRNPLPESSTENFVINLVKANRMMDSSDADAEKIDQLIRQARLSAPERDNFDQSWLFHTQGKFLQGTGRSLIATDMYQEAIRLNPVSHNPAIPSLVENYLSECREEALDNLMREYQLPKSRQYQQARLVCSTR